MGILIGAAVLYTRLSDGYAPDSIAVIHWGNLESRMIRFQEAFWLSPPSKMLKTSPTGIFTVP